MEAYLSFLPSPLARSPGPKEGPSPGDSLTPMLGLRHRHLLYLPPNGMETLRANGAENSMPQLELAVVGGPAKPGASGGRPER